MLQDGIYIVQVRLTKYSGLENIYYALEDRKMYGNTPLNMVNSAVVSLVNIAILSIVGRLVVFATRHQNIARHE